MTDFLLQVAGGVIGSVGSTMIFLVVLNRYLPAARRAPDGATDIIVTIVVSVALVIPLTTFVFPDLSPSGNGFVLGVCLTIGSFSYGIWTALRARRATKTDAAL